MSTTYLDASELAPVVHVLASAFDGARGTMANRERAAALLAPALTANARAYNHGLPAAEHFAPLDAATLLAVCSVSYCTRNGLRRDTVRALRALGSLRYNSGTLSAEEQGAMLDAYALCARVAAEMMSGEE